MGQKVSPIGLRLGINKKWQSTWYADKNLIQKLMLLSILLSLVLLLDTVVTKLIKLKTNYQN